MRLFRVTYLPVIKTFLVLFHRVGEHKRSVRDIVIVQPVQDPLEHDIPCFGVYLEKSPSSLSNDTLNRHVTRASDRMFAIAHGSNHTVL